jgi:glycerol-3-phosphate dehydrogenase
VHEVAARVAVNAAGPWVDAFNEEATPGREPELLSVTRGSHLVVRPPVELPSIALISTARSDGRVFFAVPQDGLLLIGTTDDRYEGDPGDVRPTADDVAYLLDEAEALLPGLHIGVDDICYTYAGVRPLRREPGSDESAISRTHAIISHGESGGLQELYSLVGGKLSTYRPLARQFLREVYDLRRPVDGQEARPPSAMMPDDLLLAEGLPDQARRLLQRYGPAASSVVALGLEVIHGESGLTDGMVRHAARHEEASTLADIVMRRTGLCWAADRGESAWERVADIAARELGWDDAARDEQLAGLRHEVAFNLPKPGEPWLPMPT